MKVLLIATNQANRYMDRMTVRPVPVGLAYVAAHVQEPRHNLSVLDLMFTDDATTATRDAVQRFQPEVIGLSVRNLDNQSYLNTVWHLPAVRDLIGHIRAVSQAPIVCGGPAFSILPAACFDYPAPDLGMAGDAAESFAHLVDRLEDGNAYTDLPGIVYRDQDHAVVREGSVSADFHTPPRLDLLDLSRYDKAGFGIGVVNKLAPYYYTTVERQGQEEGADWRIRPVEEVIAELQQLQRDHGISKVFFIDSGFNIPLHQAKELCQGLLHAGLRVRWNSYMRPGACDAELIELMRRSGCSLVLLTATSGYDDAALDLPERLATIQRLATLCDQGGLPFTLSVNFGSSGETRATVAQKLDGLRVLQPAFATLRVATRVLPHTPLAETALAEGLIQSPADLIRPTFYLAAEVRSWLAEHLRAEAAAYPRWHLM